MACKAILFNLRQIEEMGLIKIDMAKKLISNRELEIVKIGNKIHVSRTVLLKFIEENTIEAAS
ncbi:MAG: DNA-binding protein [Sulfuricurvum sp.]